MKKTIVTFWFVYLDENGMPDWDGIDTGFEEYQVPKNTFVYVSTKKQLVVNKCNEMRKSLNLEAIAL